MSGSPEEYIQNEFKKVIDHVKVGRIEMAADIMSAALIGAGCIQKHAICRNGPEELNPLFVYVSKDQVAFGEVMEGWHDPTEATKQALLDLKKATKSGAHMVALVSDTAIAVGNVEDRRLFESIEEMEEAGLEVQRAVSVITVHPYEDGHRVVYLSRGYHFGDGEVQFNDHGLSSDTWVQGEGGVIEVGSQTAEALIEFITNNPIKEEQTDDPGTDPEDQ